MTEIESVVVALVRRILNDPSSHFAEVRELALSIDKELSLAEYVNMGEVSDGYHTFNELYRHRSALFVTLVRKFPEISWFSKLHQDGTMFDGMFIVGMELPTGQITYHLNVDPYFEMLRATQALELEHSLTWDGHTSDDVMIRLLDWKDDRFSTLKNLAERGEQL